MSESFAEQQSRVELMSRGDPTWDLSPNDCLALGAVLADNERLRELHAEIVGELYGQGFEVAGWHQNGDLQPLDSWFEDNDWTTASRQGRRG